MPFSLRPRSSPHIARPWLPRAMTWQAAPAYSMRSLRALGVNPGLNSPPCQPYLMLSGTDPSTGGAVAGGVARPSPPAGQAAARPRARAVPETDFGTYLSWSLWLASVESFGVRSRVRVREHRLSVDQVQNARISPTEHVVRRLDGHPWLNGVNLKLELAIAWRL